MSDVQVRPPQGALTEAPPSSEGGLRAPPGLGFWGKAWWWFHFLILVKLARLRFIGLLVAIGLVIVKWDDLAARYERWTRPADADHAAAADTEYYCPMHPGVVRDHAKEKCPICFMPLSKRKKGDATTEPLPPGVVNRLQLTPYRVVLAGIKTWKVDYVPLAKEVTTVGFVEFDERELKQVAARVKGRIDKLHVSETGAHVDTGAVLASLYSPDLMVTVQNLLDAKAAGNSGLLEVTRNRLELWGVSKGQIEAILKSGKAPTHLDVHAPIHGHILRKYVKEGQYVEEGAPLFDVVDLSSVWIQGQVYEEDMAFLPDLVPVPKGGKGGKRVDGPKVKATTRAFPGQEFDGQLTFIYPHLDADTRTVIARFELKNPGHKLRPGTSATVKFQVAPGELELFQKARDGEWARGHAADWAAQALAGGRGPAGVAPAFVAAVQAALLRQGHVLAVPETAVIDTGSQRIVYREILPGEYEGVLVELGPRMVGPKEVVYYPVLSGLAPGEQVVTAGSFLIDAETRLNPAAGSIYFGGSGGKGGAVSSVRPSTPADMDAKVKAALALLSAEDRRLAVAQGTCPVQKSPLGSMGKPWKVTLNQQTVFLCCQSCEGEARKNPEEMLARVAGFKAQGPGKTVSPPPPTSPEEAEIKASIAKLNSAEDRRLVELQKWCPSSKARLGSMGMPYKVMIQGEPVFFCCESCRPRTSADETLRLKEARDLKAQKK
jgi:Cu(I)/Ag(I) efflux system membrane fusion protein